VPTVRSKRRAYLSSFDNRIRGYNETLAEIAQIAKEYRVYYQKVPTGDGGYTMDHSAVIYLMGPDGKLVTVIPYQEEDTSAIAAALTPTS
jgi:protein SCO1